MKGLKENPGALLDSYSFGQVFAALPSMGVKEDELLDTVGSYFDNEIKTATVDNSSVSSQINVLVELGSPKSLDMFESYMETLIKKDFRIGHLWSFVRNHPDRAIEIADRWINSGNEKLQKATIGFMGLFPMKVLNESRLLEWKRKVKDEDLLRQIDYYLKNLKEDPAK